MLSLYLLTFVAVFTISPILASSQTGVRCTNEIVPLKELNYTASRKGGATIETIQAVSVENAKKCADSCCQEPEGKCNIGLFRNTEEQNCLLLTCQPFAACFFQPTTDDIYLVLVTTNKTLTTIAPIIENESTEKNFVLNNVKFNNSSKNTKISPSSNNDELSSQEPISLAKTKIDNHLENDSKQNFNISEKTEIANSTDNKDQSLKQSSDFNSTSSPTSAVISVSSTTVLAINLTDQIQNGFHISKENSLDADKSKGSKPRKQATVNDSRVELTKIFQPENDTEFSNTSSSTTSSAEKQTPTLNNDEASESENQTFSSTLRPNDSVNPNDLSKEAFVETPPPLSAKDTKIHSTSVESTTHSAIVTQVPFSSNPSSNATHLSNQSTTSAIESETSTLSASSKTSPSSKNETFSESSTKNSISEATINSTKPPTAFDSSKDDGHAKDKAKFHLVIALVLGLMLLLTVVGLILRRIYDVWQRRHYQRMDFLIDGLYNSVNT